MWRIRLLSQAEKEYDALSEAVRAAALAVLDALAEDPFPEGALAVGGHRNLYRVRFYRDQYRMIYSVSKSQRKIVVTKIRRRNEKTYRGYEPQHFG
jgi:mRNA-degrading endonuclease RelE of RelBE toxin-antitoxin system